jgi:hypothetical protein
MRRTDTGSIPPLPGSLVGWGVPPSASDDVQRAAHLLDAHRQVGHQAHACGVQRLHRAALDSVYGAHPDPVSWTPFDGDVVAARAEAQQRRIAPRLFLGILRRDQPGKLVIDAHDPYPFRSF